MFIFTVLKSIPKTKTIYHLHKTNKQVDEQSLINVSTNASLEYSSCGCVCCDAYKLNELIIHQIDDIKNCLYIPNFNLYYGYTTKQFNKCYWIIKYNVMNRIQWNTINNKKQYVLINLFYVPLLYEITCLMVSILCAFVITKYLSHHLCIVFDYYHKQNINYKNVFICFYYNKHFRLSIDISGDIQLVVQSKGYCTEIEFGAIKIYNVMNKIKMNILNDKQQVVINLHINKCLTKLILNWQD